MNNVEINFKLDSQKQIVLKIDAMNLAAIDRCMQCTVFLFVNKKKYELFHDLAEYALKKFKIFLEKALSNKLKLHSSIVMSSGYLWNQKLQKKSDLTYIKLENTNRWVGLENQLWETRAEVSPELATWLYNDEKGITFEVTPIYRWHFYEKEYAKNVIKIIFPTEIG